MSRMRLFVPLAAFAGLVVVLYLGFTLRDPHELPSALVGHPFPEFELPALADSSRHIDQNAIKGEVRLVNVWATWCPTCLAEHSELMRIKREAGLSIIGINYKDISSKAIAWLKRYGDPYDFNVVDPEGVLGVELGVYGAPETFVVDADGIIRYKRVGDVNERIWRDELAPLIESLTDG